MIANIFKSDKPSSQWVAHPVRDEHYYLEHSDLQNLVTTRIYCNRMADKSRVRTAWPTIRIKLGKAVFKCSSTYIERALNISQTEIHDAYQSGKKKLRELLDRRAIYLKSQLEKLVAYRDQYLLKIANIDSHLTTKENLLKLIKELESRKIEWLNEIAKEPGTCIIVSDLAVPILITQTGKIIVEFPTEVEKGTGKIVHEAYDYCHAKPMVVARPLDEKAWSRELRVQQILTSKENAKLDLSLLMTSESVCDLFYVQMRCQSDLLSKIHEFYDDRKLLTAFQLAKAIASMHRLGIVHCDIKMENVLIDHDKIFVTDFGFSCIGVLRKVRECWGTRGMFAPEMMRDATIYLDTYFEGIERDYRKFDSFSLGVVFWSMCYEMLSPFDEPDRILTMTEIDEIMDFKEKLQKPKKGTLGRVICGLLKKNPDKRWNMEKTVKQLQDIVVSRDATRGFRDCLWFNPHVLQKYRLEKEASQKKHI